MMGFADSRDYWNSFLKTSYATFNTFYDKFLSKSPSEKYETHLVIDCCSGISAYHQDNIRSIMKDFIDVSFINTDHSVKENLNSHSGAEYVHKVKKLPVNHPRLSGDTSVKKSLSFDGDVDRIIYYATNEENTEIKMIDGDHFIVLFAKMLKFLIEKLSPKLQEKFHSEISLGVCCTAYSNGTFMDYIRNVLKLKLTLTKTGVKNLHAGAYNYDIAIYFESNGHGTVYYNNSVKEKIERLYSFIESSADSQVLEMILIFLSLFNRTTGDSLSAMIATECCLKVMNMTVRDFYYLYNELDYVNITVKVKNKNDFVPNEDETRLIEPVDVQKVIDEVVSKYSFCKARSFVRPSGTEDVIRVYSEAESMKEAVEVAELVKKYIQEYY